MTKQVAFITLLVLGAAAGLLVLFVLLFERYAYYDYTPVDCRAGDARLHVTLSGRFGKDHPHTRSSPYTLSIEVSGAGTDQNMERIKLIQSAPASTPLTPEFKRIDRMPTDDPAVSFWILAKPLDLVYQDVTVEGELRNRTKKADAIRFSCSLPTSPQKEWRAPWFDALMSI